MEFWQRPVLKRSSKTIYLVDDDTAVREALVAVLDASGYDVVSFSSAGALLESFDPTVTACLILDLDLPDMTGIELSAQLRAAGSTTPFIVITAHDGSANEARAKAAGAAAFLDKPISKHRLISAIERAFAET